MSGILSESNEEVRGRRRPLASFRSGNKRGFLGSYRFLGSPYKEAEAATAAAATAEAVAEEDDTWGFLGSNEGTEGVAATGILFEVFCSPYMGGGFKFDADEAAFELSV